MRSAKAEKNEAHSAGNDAIALLKADHAAVKQLFKEYEQLCKKDSDDSDKGELANRICRELTIHATIEEESFYPALRQVLEQQDILDEAEVEHAGAKELIGQIEQMKAGDDLYDAKVIVLGEYINHHVGEEEGEMFKQARASEVDLQALGDEMRTRQQELKAELGAEDDEEGDEEAQQSTSAKPAVGGGKTSRRAA